VVKIKKIFYNSGFAKYDDCLNGGLRLVPNTVVKKLWKVGYKQLLIQTTSFDDFQYLLYTINRHDRNALEVKQYPLSSWFVKNLLRNNGLISSVIKPTAKRWI
jgi:hypothetical protein